MKLRLGLRYELRAPSPDGDSPGTIHAKLLAHAERADALGIDVLWVAERSDAALPAALPVCAALAVRTRRARIGTCVLPLPLHHPLRLAEDAATLDALAGGRLELGLGLGADADAFAGFDVPWGERGTRFEEGIELLQRAWAHAPIEFVGRHWRAQGIEVWPKPASAPGPPLWIGARSGVAIERAARRCDGLLATSLDGALAFLAARVAAGREPGAARVALLLPLVLVEDPALERRAGPTAPRRSGAAPGRGGAPLVCGVEEALARIRPALDALRDCPALDIVLPAQIDEGDDARRTTSLDLLCQLRPGLSRQRGAG